MRRPLFFLALLLAVLPQTTASAAGAAGTPRAPADSVRAAERGQPRVAPRRLEATRIEGEIPAPQVLFITTRDQRRFFDFQHHRYDRTSLDLVRATPALSRLVLVPGPVQPSPEGSR